MNFKSTIFLSRKLDTPYRVDDYLNIIDTPLFESLVRSDLILITTIETSGEFFEKHGAFINPSRFLGNPVAGIDLWLRLLEKIERSNPEKYRQIHKGTPYFHAGILCLFATKYLEAFEWLGYAFEQDIKPENRETPAIWLLSFDTREGQETVGVEYGKTKLLLSEIETIFKWINIHDTRFKHNADVLRGLAKAKILTSACSRPLLAAWVTLLSILLSHRDIIRYLRIAPCSEEAQLSVHNVLSNLTLILETLIKESPAYSCSGLKKDSQLGDLLEKIIAPAFSFKWCNMSFIQSTITKNYDNIFREISVAEQTDDKVAVSFTVAQRVRNNAHHLFHEKYLDEETYKCLYYRIIYAILRVIFNLYA